MGVRELLLTRQGRVSLPQMPGASDDTLVQAVELELAQLGYVASTRLRAALGRLAPEELASQRSWLVTTLANFLGAGARHAPLFRSFPEGVPKDTGRLWVQKVLSHYLQEGGQPCLFCGATGTTHVLRPCQHIVCDQCFDGSNYNACPVCEHHVDPGSPFFRPNEMDRSLSTQEKVLFKRLDLCEDLTGEARKLYVSLCERPQAMSPDDVAALTTLVLEYQMGVLPWTPEKIPVRENRAHIFGILLRSGNAADVLAAARPHLGTATDVLRLIAAYSGADPGLQPTARTVQVQGKDLRRWSKKSRETIEKLATYYQRYKILTVPQPIATCRFPVGKLSRPLRRALLSLLESFPSDSVMEDMLRRPADWVWIGEFLHPFEYASRFPSTARAFAVVRRSKGPLIDHLANPLEGDPRYRRDRGRLRFLTFNHRTEARIAARDGAGLSAHLAERPGELARRLDLALRLGNPEVSLARFLARMGSMTTPVLLGLATSLRRRQRKWPVRVYFPKGAQFKAPSSWDKRAMIPKRITAPLVEAIERELLQRFAQKPAFAEGLIDRGLQTVPVPFNERTASPSAVTLPRGSWIPVPKARETRLFMYWCQPERGEETDLDLSVGLYAEDWSYLDVCSYYQLETTRNGRVIARSSGDFRDAPYPDGASEFIDLNREAALATGIRYAVMVVTAYAGMPFSELEHAFAGLMVRDNLGGAIFDPRTVRLRFNLTGQNGVYMPLVFDLAESRVFWLDGYSTGDFAMNSVASANNAIQRICGETIAYFGHGVRPSLFHLGALHAAARCQRVQVRHPEGFSSYERGEDEGAYEFYHRLLADAEERRPLRPIEHPAFVAVLDCDLDVPEGSLRYALFREQWTDTIAASDLLAG